MIKINNPILRRYWQIYENIYAKFLHQIIKEGLPLGADEGTDLVILRRTLQKKGALFANNGHSISYGWTSSACEACRQGKGSYTFFVSLKCHRHCYYCFNPNQQNYEQFTKKQRNYRRELQELYQSGQMVKHLALTGGEPLLLPAVAVDFFQQAKQLFPTAYSRLYTSGDLLDVKVLEGLQVAGLQEIRVSIKLEDSQDVIETVLNNLQLAAVFVPNVMVEMPVIPGSLEVMKGLLQRLARIGVKGINLLEFCFPFFNHAEFKSRGFKIKNPPYQVLYDYWYAGGLPVAESEQECLQLLIYAMESELPLGIHVCTLENKHTGQVYQQNYQADLYYKGTELYYFSSRDYFFKTVKVFGDDIAAVQKTFKLRCFTGYDYNREYDYLEFPIYAVAYLQSAGLILELAVASLIREWHAGQSYLREVKLDLVQTMNFHIEDL